MKAHKYLKHRLVISAVYTPSEYDGNPTNFHSNFARWSGDPGWFSDKINKK